MSGYLKSIVLTAKCLYTPNNSHFTYTHAVCIYNIISLNTACKYKYQPLILAFLLNLPNQFKFPTTLMQTYDLVWLLAML